MGSFFGHALPGTFFIFFSVWWTVQAFRRYFVSLGKNSAPFVATASFPVVIRGRRINVEAIAVTVMTSLGIFVELVLASIKNSHFGGGTNFQHSTMYFCFGLVGVVSLVLPKLNVFPNHEDINYAFLILAYVVEALLFTFHLHGRQNLDVHVHKLLVYSIYGCVLATIAEMRYRDNLLGTLSRAFFTLLQGTWFWQVSFILYNPSKGMAWGGHAVSEDHEYVMLVTCGFIWHMAAIIILMTVCGAVIGWRYRRRGLVSSSAEFEMRRSYGGSEGYTVVADNDPEEASDINGLIQ